MTLRQSSKVFEKEISFTIMFCFSFKQKGKKSLSSFFLYYSCPSLVCYCAIREHTCTTNLECEYFFVKYSSVLAGIISSL